MANKRRDNAIEQARRGRDDVKRMAGNRQGAEGAENAPGSDAASSVQKTPQTSTQDQNTSASHPPAAVAKSDAAPPPAADAEQRDSGDNKTQDQSPTEYHEALPAEKAQDGPTDENQIPVVVGPDDLRVISLDDMLVGGINTRVVDRESVKFQELMASIRDEGQLSPLLVGREGDKYRLIAGERRYWAMRTVGLATAKVVVTTAPREKWDDLNLVENLMREDLSVWEEAVGYRKLINQGASQEEVAARVHKSETHVSLILKVSRNPQLVAALDEGVLSSDSMAKEVARLIDSDGKEIVPGALQRALNYIGNSKHPLTIREVRAYISLMLEQLEPEKPKTTRRNVRYGSFLRTERTRLESVIAMASELAPEEVAILGDTYAQTSRILMGLVSKDRE